jgi:hypothetical protein
LYGIEAKHILKENKIKDNNKRKTNTKRTLHQWVVINNAKNFDNKVTETIVEEEEDIKFLNSLTM